MNTFSIPYNIMSQNTRDSLHWSKRNRDTKKAEGMIRLRPRAPKANGMRDVWITSYRSQRCADIANLIGGAKGLIDAIVRAGLLVDDSDKFAHIHYEQFPLSKMPPDLAEQFSGRPCTTISLEDSHVSDVK